MRSAQKLSLGSLFGVVGAAGVIFGPMFSFPGLARPWSFILGFIFGLFAGLGATLAISGLLDRRKEKSGG